MEEYRVIVEESIVKLLILDQERVQVAPQEHIRVEVQDDDKCPICLDGLKNGEEMVVLARCRHVLHWSCADEWLAIRPCCPLCRTSVRRWGGMVLL